jgi:allantoicase
LRLNIFPDGGVARLRAYGTVEPDWSVRDVDAEAQPHVQPDWVDQAALTSGAVPLASSDAFFSPMEQLLMPGLASDMGGGWETRRRRAPGHDWILVQLGSPGVPRTFEVDTSHFKGNYPDRCSVDVLSAPVGTPITELMASELWTPALPPRPLEAHRRHFFEALETPTVSHVRLAIHPDGGLSRFRVWGSR